MFLEGAAYLLIAVPVRPLVIAFISGPVCLLGAAITGLFVLALA